MPTLKPYQQKIVDSGRKKCGLFLGTGTGKTAVGVHLMRGETLVVVPKDVRLEKRWENECVKFSINQKHMTVMSKEQFKKAVFGGSIKRYDTLIIDEAHNHFGVYPETRRRNKVIIPKTSQLFEATLTYIQEYKPEHLYLATATPASKPMHVYALLTLFGVCVDFFQFRERYYTSRKMGYRELWIPIIDKKSKEELSGYLMKVGYVGTLFDFEDIPEQTHIVKRVQMTKEQVDEISELHKQEADIMAVRAQERTIENGVRYMYTITSDGNIDTVTRGAKHIKNEKIDAILSYAEEFPRMLVFANYTAQIEMIDKALRDAGYYTVLLTGKTKDSGAVLKDAAERENCIVIAQSSKSEGYDALKWYPVVVFASKSNQFKHYEQALGRVLRGDAIKKNLYIHLVTDPFNKKIGGRDKANHDTILSGKDFQEMLVYNI